MKVSVLILAYNHEKFIAQAIESAVMQEVDFEYEIIIGEDCSKDNTRNIVIEYQEKYPQKIRLLLHEKNVGMHRNFDEVLQTGKGQYLAILEGDDYWVSPYKLQKQVDFLDTHSECSICFHNATVFYEDEERDNWEYCHAINQEILGIEQLLISNFIPTPSVMYRGGIVKNLPDWFYELSMVDWPFHILHAKYGQIGYINEVMSAYRIHSRGVWSSKNSVEQLQATIKMFEQISVHLQPREQLIVKEVLSFYISQLAEVEKHHSATTRDLQNHLKNHLGLRDINLIIFPEWNQPEAGIYQDLVNAIDMVINHSDINNITLLIHTSSINNEYANLVLSDVVMNLMMQSEYSLLDSLEISLIGDMPKKEWQAILPLINARMYLEKEDQYAIKELGAETIPVTINLDI